MAVPVKSYHGILPYGEGKIFLDTLPPITQNGSIILYEDENNTDILLPTMNLINRWLEILEIPVNLLVLYRKFT